MLYELTCVNCGQTFVPTRTDLVLGPRWYRRCPPCRRLPGDGEPATGNDAPIVSSPSPPSARIRE
jgi:hypothetical protein